jgi:hypothetical protein
MEIEKILEKNMEAEAINTQEATDSLLLEKVQFEKELLQLQKEYNISDDDIFYKFYRIFEKQQKSLFKAIQAQNDLNKNNIYLNTLLQKSIIATKELNDKALEEIVVVMNSETEMQISGFNKTMQETKHSLELLNQNNLDLYKSVKIVIENEREDFFKILNESKKNLESAEFGIILNKTFQIGTFLLSLSSVILMIIFFVKIFIKG